jgi:hypothetical protein
LPIQSVRGEARENKSATVTVKLLKSKRAKQPEKKLGPPEKSKRDARIDKYEKPVSHHGAAIADSRPQDHCHMK